MLLGNNIKYKKKIFNFDINYLLIYIWIIYICVQYIQIYL